MFIKYAKDQFKSGMRVLEIGPASIPSPYENIIDDPSITWHTLDLYKSYPKLTYVSSEEYNYPIESDSYDIIISGQVIEHVKQIWLWLTELKRIVKKNGYIILINPVSWPYHNFPVDCWRIFPEGMRALCEHCELRIEFCEFESIEASHFIGTSTPTIPGQSYDQENQKQRLRFIKKWNSLLLIFPYIRKLRVPIEVAYDTITIASKS